MESEAEQEKVCAVGSAQFCHGHSTFPALPECCVPSARAQGSVTTVPTLRKAFPCPQACQPSFLSFLSGTTPVGRSFNTFVTGSSMKMLLVILICDWQLSIIALSHCLASLSFVSLVTPAILCLFLWMSKVSPTIAHKKQLAPRSHWWNSCCFGKFCQRVAHSLPTWRGPPDSSCLLTGAGLESVQHPTSLAWHGRAFCASGLRQGKGKQKGGFVIEKVAFYRDWSHTVKFQQTYSGMYVSHVVRRVNRKTICG